MCFIDTHLHTDESNTHELYPSGDWGGGVGALPGGDGGGGSYTHSPTSGPGPFMTKAPPGKLFWSRRLFMFVSTFLPSPKVRIERSRYSFENGPVSFMETVASKSSWDQA